MSPLVETPLPVKASTKAYVPNQETVDGLVEALSNRPEVDGRPNAVGPNKPLFDTRGKASNNGGHYQKAVKTRLTEMGFSIEGFPEFRVRLNITEPREGQYGWRLYVKGYKPDEETTEEPAPNEPPAE